MIFVYTHSTSGTKELSLIQGGVPHFQQCFKSCLLEDCDDYKCVTKS